MTTHTVDDWSSLTLRMPSAFDGETPLLTFYAAPGVECGKLWARGGVLSFEGNAEESAQTFFKFVAGMLLTDGRLKDAARWRWARADDMVWQGTYDFGFGSPSDADAWADESIASAQRSV